MYGVISRSINHCKNSYPARLEIPRSGERLSLARPQRCSCGYQSGSCCNTPCVPACRLWSLRGFRISRGYLLLLMCRLLHGVLLFKFGQVLAHRSIGLRGFRQLFSRDAALLRSVCLNESSIHRQLVAAYQSNCQASGHNFLEPLLEHLRFLKAPVAILRKGAVVRNFRIKPETCEPAPGEMHAQFLNKLALAADAVQMANQQNAQQQLWINRRTTSIAIAILQSLAHETEVNMLINQPQ